MAIAVVLVVLVIVVVDRESDKSLVAAWLDAADVCAEGRPWPHCTETTGCRLAISLAASACAKSWVRYMIVSGRLRAVAYQTGSRRTYRIREAWLIAFLREFRIGPDEIAR